MAGQTPIDPDVEADQYDQYDALLQATKEGLILTVNHNQPGMVSSEEMTVRESNDDNTDVRLTGCSNTQYRIHRTDDGELVYGELSDTGFKLEDTVITIEVIGCESNHHIANA